MAIDTRAKRASAVSTMTVTSVPGVDNTSLDQAERQASIWSYAGILASGATPAATRAPRGGFTRNVGRLTIR